MTIPIHTGLIFKGPDFIEVSRFATSFTTQCQGHVGDILTCGEEDIHVLEIAGIIHSGIVPASVVSVGLHIVESE